MSARALIFMNKIKEELADIMVYCIGLSNVLDLDLSNAIIQKIERNKVKYPVEDFKGIYRKRACYNSPMASGMNE